MISAFILSYEHLRVAVLIVLYIAAMIALLFLAQHRDRIMDYLEEHSDIVKEIREHSRRHKNNSPND